MSKLSIRKRFRAPPDSKYVGAFILLNGGRKYLTLQRRDETAAEFYQRMYQTHRKTNSVLVVELFPIALTKDIEDEIALFHEVDDAYSKGIFANASS